MIPALWTKTIYGGIAIVGNDFIVTTPRFGDGNWRGGWWAKYDRQTGECIWKQKHHRGASLFDRIGDVLIATTYKGSGVYGISLASGHRLWTRLGDRLDWLLRCFEFLPCDNEGDGPAMLWNGGILTRSGRFLDVKKGRIVSRHQLEYPGDNSQIVKIDGNPVPRPNALWVRESNVLYNPKPGPIDDILTRNKLGLASTCLSVACANGLNVCLACKPPEKFLAGSPSRLSPDGLAEDIPFYLIVFNSDCSTILKQFDLGMFYKGELDLANDTFLSITAQTRQQWSWTYQRKIWLIEWQALKKMAIIQ